MTQQNNRDPVCGMSVDPATAKYTHEFDGRTWYFCAAHCREQFLADPAFYLPRERSDAQPPLRTRLRKEALIAISLFVAAAVVIVMARGIAKSDAGPVTTPTALGTSANPHLDVDDGQGGVIVSAEHDQKQADAAMVTFMLALNTHTIDLSDFLPAEQIKLHVNSDAGAAPLMVTAGGETTGHHQNYIVTFQKPESQQVVLSVHDVAGVGERQLPFSL